MKTKIIFNGSQISRTQVKNNILRVWNQSTPDDRDSWYQSAHDYASALSQFGSIPIKKTIGIIAALSPLTPWTKNKELAEKLILDRILPEAMPCLKLSAYKAFQILHGLDSTESILSTLNGQKTSSFFLNILNPQEDKYLTIDRHATSISIGRKLPSKKLSLNKNQYQFFSDCYRRTAEILEVSPLLLQSTTWTIWRKIK